jgi:hypothetical protein
LQLLAAYVLPKASQRRRQGAAKSVVQTQQRCYQIFALRGRGPLCRRQLGAPQMHQRHRKSPAKATGAKNAAKALKTGALAVAQPRDAAYAPPFFPGRLGARACLRARAVP